MTEVNEISVQKITQEISKTQQILHIIEEILLNKNVKINFFLKENKILREKYHIKNKKIEELENNQSKTVEEENELDNLKKEKTEITNKIINENLEFYTYIDGIKYEFSFTTSKISMTNILTNVTVEMPYNKDICSFAIKFSEISTNYNNFYRKNCNGLSIANIILKNINSSLVNGFREYNNIFKKTSIEFIKAICESGNNIDSFKYFFTNHFLNNCSEYDLSRIFFSACFGGNFEIIHILEHFIENKKKYKINYFPLFEAVKGNNLDIIKWLLEIKEVKVGLNKYILYYMIDLFKYIKNPEIALYFLNTNYIKNYFSITDNYANYDFFYRAISEVIARGHIEVADILLKEAKNKNVDIKKDILDIKNNAFAIAVSQENIEVVQLLLQDPDIDVNTQDDNILTQFAYKYKKTIQLPFQNSKINANMQNIEKKTVLSYAVNFEYIEIVQLLLQHPNVKIEKKDLQKIINLIGQKNFDNYMIIRQQKKIEMGKNSQNLEQDQVLIDNLTNITDSLNLEEKPKLSFNLK